MSDAPSQGSGEGGREILFEFVQLGVQVRVAALDAATGTEAVIIGPSSAARSDLEQVAVRKLMHLLHLDRTADEDEKTAPPSRGKLV